ncbi:MAG: 4Fe-4S binding protein [Candidatus Thorarchaeota archaeon]
MGKKTKIEINYSLCGDGLGIDPRDCAKCLQICSPAIFLLHETFGVQEENPFDPQLWRVTPVYLSLCTKCMKCVEICPVKAITIT